MGTYNGSSHNAKPDGLLGLWAFEEDLLDHQAGLVNTRPYACLFAAAQNP